MAIGMEGLGRKECLLVVSRVINYGMGWCIIN